MVWIVVYAQGQTKGFRFIIDYDELHYTFYFILIHFSAFCDTYTVYRQYTGLFQNSRMHLFLLDAIAEK